MSEIKSPDTLLDAQLDYHLAVEALLIHAEELRRQRERLMRLACRAERPSNELEVAHAE